MVDPEFLVFDGKGLYCSAGDFYLDPGYPVRHAVVSHAHGDHACTRNGTVYCTAATAAFMRYRLKKNAGEAFRIFAFHTPFMIGGVKITLIPAGHILGSSQVLMEYMGIRYLYTGDFKLQPDETCEPLVFVKADVLITESTFADPAIIHPDPETEIQKLNQSFHNVLLGAYSLGKAQRLVKLINKISPQRQILVHHKIFPLNKVYESHGFPPGMYELYNRKLMKEPGKGFVYIVPPLTFNSYFKATGVLRAFASGWKSLQSNNDLALYISDHADWEDILYMISQVRPSEIWTLHGNGQYLKEHLDKQIPVKILQSC